MINSTKFYAPVVTLSINGNITLLEKLTKVFKRTISWNKYKSEITQQPRNNNLDYVIDPTLRNINRLLGLSFKNCDSNPTRNFFDKYYIPQDINFTEKLEDDNDATMFFIAERQEKTILKSSLDLLNVTEQLKQRNIKKY